MIEVQLGIEMIPFQIFFSSPINSFCRCENPLKNKSMWLYLFLSAFALPVELGVQAAPVSKILVFICSYIIFFFL